jgi:hypothetical protein
VGGLGPIRFITPKHQDPEPVTPVWVHLELLCPRPDERRVVGDGLDWSGRVRGELRRWWRTVDGLWLGQVTYELGWADGRNSWLRIEDQLIPASALSPRHDGTYVRHEAQSLATR